MSAQKKGSRELDPENGDHHATAIMCRATAIMCRVCFLLEYYYRQKNCKLTREPVSGEYGCQDNRFKYGRSRKVNL